MAGKLVGFEERPQSWGVIAKLLSHAAGTFDVAVVRIVQGLARAAAGPGPHHLERLARLQNAARCYEAIEPERFFSAPAALERVNEELVRKLPGGEVVDLRWESAWQPHEQTGRDAYLAWVENKTACARILRHHTPRPALVCLHGYRAGVFRFEEIAWNSGWLYRLGLDVVHLTLPFHGPRAPRNRSAPMFPSARIGRTVEGFGQAIWDLRSLLGWLRARGAPLAGVAGMSLGGYATALLATVEPRLDYAVLFIPLGDLTDVAVEHEALRGQRVPGWLADAGRQALRLIRPLARTPVIAGDHMLVAAAQADRITSAATHAHRLAEHFDAPLVTFTGSHLLQLGRRTAFLATRDLLERRGAIGRR